MCRPEEGWKVHAGEEVKAFEEVAIKLCTRSRIKDGAIKDEDAAREEPGRKLIEVRLYSLLVVCFHVG